MEEKNKGAFLSGIAAGVVNGFFGAGGGLILVPMLRKTTKCPEKAHATSIAVVLPLCVASTFFYKTGADVVSAEVLPFIVGGVLGAPLGAFFLKKIPAGILGRLFGAFMIFSAVRMLTNG